MSATREAPPSQGQVPLVRARGSPKFGLGELATVLQMVLELHETFSQLIPVLRRDDPFAVEALEDVVFDAYETSAASRASTLARACAGNFAASSSHCFICASISSLN